MRRLLVFAAAAALLYLVSLDPVRGIFGFVFGWALLGYLTWRAWPAVRQDARNLRALLPSAGPRKMRGLHL